MNVYKGLIIGVALLIVGGALYYFQAQGTTSLISQGVKQGANGKSYGVSAMEVFSGLYECKEDSGCKYETKLLLEDDTTLDITATIEGQEVSLGQGTWGIGKDGSLVLVLQTTDSVAGGPPRSLIAKKISSLRISGFSNKKSLFQGMTNPTFVRVKNDDAQKPSPQPPQESQTPQEEAPVTPSAEN